MQDVNLQLYEKRLFHASYFTDFVFIFSKYITITSSEKTLKSESTVSFWKCKRKLVLLVTYPFNYDSPKSTFFMLSYGIWRPAEYSFYQISWNPLFLAIIYRLQEHNSFCYVFWYVLFYKYIYKYIFSIMVIIVFYFDIYVKFTLLAIIFARKTWCHHNFFMIKILQLSRYNFFIIKISHLCKKKKQY